MILPQKLQIGEIEGEPEGQRKIRERQVLDNLKTERELLNLRAQSHEDHVEKIDEDMISNISQRTRGRRKAILVDMWKEACKKEEEISKRRWDGNNYKWLQKSENVFTEKYLNSNTFFWKESIQVIVDKPNQGPRYNRNNRRSDTYRRPMSSLFQSELNSRGQNYYRTYATVAGRNPNTDRRTTYIHVGKNVTNYRSRNTTQHSESLQSRTHNSISPNNKYYNNQNRYQANAYQSMRPPQNARYENDQNTKQSDTKVINILSKILNKHHCQLLQISKIYPHPFKNNPQELECDIQEFLRKLCLAEYFDGEKDPDPSLVRNRSDFIPPKNINEARENFVTSINHHPRNQNNTTIKSNITRDERKPLKILQMINL